MDKNHVRALFNFSLSFSLVINAKKILEPSFKNYKYDLFGCEPR